MNNLSFAIYLEAKYNACRKGWPITRRWVAENNFILCAWANILNGHRIW
jgi:hypothetical protein